LPKSVDVRCPKCRHEFRRPFGLIGHREKCPECKFIFTIPPPLAALPYEETDLSRANPLEQAMPQTAAPESASEQAVAPEQIFSNGPQPAAEVGPALNQTPSGQSLQETPFSTTEIRYTNPGEPRDKDVQTIIQQFGLQPHPEGGFFRETYRCAETIPATALPPRYGKDRNLSTAIYYLLTPDGFSALHRLQSDEIFHFYAGDPVTMLQLHADGRAETIVLGRDVAAGQQLQVVVPRGVWQGMILNDGGAFALLGTTVSPGFDFADFELGIRAALIRQYPSCAALIERLTAN
jgi:uncharacterized protein